MSDPENSELYYHSREYCHSYVLRKLQEVEGEDKRKALVEWRDKNRWTILHVATRSGDAELVKRLLQHNCNINAVNIEVQTALHLASIYGHLTVAACLLDQQGCQINKTDGDGNTALHLALLYRRSEVAKYLINGACDVAMTDNWGNRTALHLAGMMDCPEVAQLLLESKTCDLSSADRYKWTPLHWASRRGLTKAVELMLAQKCNVKAKTNFNSTALHLAARFGHLEAVKLLLPESDVNAVNNDGWTALHSASCRGHLEVVKLLLTKGIDPLIIDNVGRMAVYFAMKMESWNAKGEEVFGRHMALEQMPVSQLGTGKKKLFTLC